MKEILGILASGKNLTETQASQAMRKMLSGESTAAQSAAFLMALRIKGETVDELTGTARAMREAALSISRPNSVVVDTCGTGGDGTGTLNISTASAFVVAAAGFCVAKHGNRSVSSRCGSADVLEALGVRVNASKDVSQRCLTEAGIAFLFAPTFHPAMKYVAPVRRELGVRTLFNLLGPLCNPAKADVQVLGAYSEEAALMLAQVLRRLTTREVWVVHSGGLDEISLSGKTRVVEVRGKQLKRFSLTHSDFNLPKGNMKGLAGGGPQENARAFRRLLVEKESGPFQDVVLANAGAAIFLAARAVGRKNIKSLPEAVEAARESIASGKANEKLERLIALTNGLS